MNSWTVTLAVTHRGNVDRVTVVAHHASTDPDSWPSLTVYPEPFDDLLEVIRNAVIDCTAEGWATPLPGMRIAVD